MTTPTTAAKQGLRALDPDLPSLASEAAVDLDNLLASRSKEFSAINGLAARLKNSVELSNSGGAPRALMDPATLTVLGEALAHAVITSPSTRVDEVLSKAAKMATDLSAVELMTDVKQIEQARDFCVALSRSAASYRRAIRDLRPHHPFRR